MELRHLRYFLAVGEQEHYGRAAEKLHVAQPALSRQIQDLEREIGFSLFERLPRGVKLSAAGKLFLEDAKRILQQLDDARSRAQRVARGQAGTLRIGFTENSSWHGVVPESIRAFRQRVPDAELQLNPLTSPEQLGGVRSGQLDAGFIYSAPKGERELDQIPIATHGVSLAVPKGHPLIKLKTLRLRDLVDVPFVWFPRHESPSLYDALMNACYRGGLKSPRIVQDGRTESMMLSLVSQSMGVGFVNETARWRCPESVVILNVTDLKMPLLLSLVWRNDNSSALLKRLVEVVGSLLETRVARGR